MTRWQPDARGRLQRAALELYVERGFEETTVAEIAERAGLTERTFFRHFSDKREVLFPTGDDFTNGFIAGMADAPENATPLEAVTAALLAVATEFEPRRPWSQERQRVINATPGLMERELIKLAGVAAALAAALRERGVVEPAATLTAQSGITIFHVAFQRWIAADNSLEFSRLITESLEALKVVTSGS
jgi:AcrR family transcriptional regulator